MFIQKKIELDALTIKIRRPTAFQSKSIGWMSFNNNKK